MQLEELQGKYRKSIFDLAKKYHVENIRVFGSVARGDATSDSDVDLLVSLGKDADLLDLGGFNYDLAHLLGVKKVGTVQENSIHWYIKDQVLKEAKPL